MGKPTEEEFHMALAEAMRMREQGEDPQHVAKALLNLNYRNHYLEQVLHAAEMYMRSGQAEREHTRLLKALELARHADDHSAGIEHEDLGLG